MLIEYSKNKKAQIASIIIAICAFFYVYLHFNLHKTLCFWSCC
ncbi:hypothetical protein M917_1636 [Psychrobacter aquaticus CMS 56]|uniref:Uncharacterized protein n=1 Tax=Psychrobacter aquaticus CMS 56 TaxID=1354303 RepID=U4T9H6_9GAMM|nr:hypothetical protein M917_1636 [Psychrobacter aquaticus CMS 56]